MMHYSIRGRWQSVQIHPALYMLPSFLTGHIPACSCVNPPLREVPPEWYCPFCAPVMDLDANLERILAARPLTKVPCSFSHMIRKPVWQAASPKDLVLYRCAFLQAPKDATARKDMEYYVKWRDRAHIHCAWVPGPRMEQVAAKSGGRGVRPKLQAFERAQVHGEVSCRLLTVVAG
jgi:hypothetical protein